MFDFFGFLRRKAREAVLGGISDAVNDITEGQPVDLESLRLKIAESTKALPAVVDDEPVKKKGGKS